MVMKKLASISVVFMSIGLSQMIWAADFNAQIGAGYHARDISDGSEDYKVDFSSPVFSARLLPSEHFAIETNYYFSGGGKYSLSGNSGSSSFETSGFELNLLLGTSMVEKGFFAYTGVGYFGENWTSNSNGNQYNATGLQAPIGVGYNFGAFSVDLQYAYRKPSAYEAEVFDAGDDIEASTYQLRLFTNL